MADQRIQSTERMIGEGHATLVDTLNRHANVEHEPDGTHKQINMTAGDGSVQAKVGGVLDIDLTAVGTTAVTTEEDLKTFSIPADTLNVAGQAIHLKAYGQFAANANTKRVKLYFGTTVIFDTTAIALNDESWIAEATIYLEDVGAQKSISYGQSQSNIFTNRLNGITENETGVLTAKVTGQNGTANAADIIVEAFEVSFGGGVE